MDQERVLDKARKLLAMAEDVAASPAEAEAFNERAMQIIAAYGIEQAMLAHDGKVTDTIIDRKVVLHAPYAVDKASLLYAIAKHNRVQSIRLSAYQGRVRLDDGTWTPKASRTVHLFGYQSDIDAVEMLYTSLQLQATTGMLAARPRYSYESLQAFRRSWLIGFTAAVRDRMEAAAERAKADAAKDGSGTALVLVDRSKQVEQVYRAAYPQTRTLTRSYSGSGRDSGYAAGQKADLGGARVGRNSQPSLGR